MRGARPWGAARATPRRHGPARPRQKKTGSRAPVAHGPPRPAPPAARAGPARHPRQSVGPRGPARGRVAHDRAAHDGLRRATHRDRLPSVRQCRPLWGCRTAPRQQRLARTPVAPPACRPTLDRAFCRDLSAVLHPPRAGQGGGASRHRRAVASAWDVGLPPASPKRHPIERRWRARKDKRADGVVQPLDAWSAGSGPLLQRYSPTALQSCAGHAYFVQAVEIALQGSNG